MNPNFKIPEGQGAPSAANPIKRRKHMGGMGKIGGFDKGQY